jgi:hypothetical protein
MNMKCHMKKEASLPHPVLKHSLPLKSTHMNRSLVFFFFDKLLYDVSSGTKFLTSALTHQSSINAAMRYYLSWQMIFVFIFITMQRNSITSWSLLPHHHYRLRWFPIPREASLSKSVWLSLVRSVDGILQLTNVAMALFRKSLQK